MSKHEPKPTRTLTGSEYKKAALAGSKIVLFNFAGPDRLPRMGYGKRRNRLGIWLDWFW